jgi:adenosylhomocysteine nucleosidase
MAVSGDRSIGILSAIPPERLLLSDALVDPAVGDLAGRHAVAGRLDDREVVVADAGVGKVNAAVATTLLVERHGCRAVIFTGVAGGLDPTLSIGDVVIAEHLVQHDTGVLADTGLERYQPGHVPFFNPTDRFGYSPSTALIDRIRSLLVTLSLPPVELGVGEPREPRVVLGRILTGDQFVDSAIEMEGAAVAQVAELAGVDYLVIRALSDLAGEGSRVDFGRFLPAVAETSVRVLRHLLPVI